METFRSDVKAPFHGKGVLHLAGRSRWQFSLVLRAHEKSGSVLPSSSRKTSSSASSLRMRSTQKLLKRIALLPGGKASAAGAASLPKADVADRPLLAETVRTSQRPGTAVHGNAIATATPSSHRRLKLIPQRQRRRRICGALVVNRAAPGAAHSIRRLAIRRDGMPTARDCQRSPPGALMARLLALGNHDDADCAAQLRGPAAYRQGAQTFDFQADARAATRLVRCPQGVRQAPGCLEAAPPAGQAGAARRTCARPHAASQWRCEWLLCLGGLS